MRRAPKLRAEQGQAAAELALVLPILCALLLAIAQFGIAFNNYLKLTDATRAGARKAAVSRFTGDAGAAATTLTQSLAPNGAAVSVTATSWTVPGSDVTVSASYPFSINILGWTVKSGTMTSTQQERLE
jgi:Flp pilus assembly protein TadG